MVSGIKKKQLECGKSEKQKRNYTQRQREGEDTQIPKKPK